MHKGPVIQAKEKHTAKINAKLDNPNTAPKMYWSIMTRFLSKKKNASHTTHSCSTGIYLI